MFQTAAEVANEEVGEHPVGCRPINGCGTLFGVDYREGERGVAFCLPRYGLFERDDISAPTSSRSALAVAQSNAMHLFSSVCRISVAIVWPPSIAKAIHAGSDKKVGAESLSGADHFVDVALAITDMNAPRGFALAMLRIDACCRAMIGRFCVSPILGRQRQARPERAAHPLDELAKTLPQSCIREGAPNSEAVG